MVSYYSIYLSGHGIDIWLRSQSCSEWIMIRSNYIELLLWADVGDIALN